MAKDSNKPPKDATRHKKGQVKEEKEYERRWIVFSMDPDTARFPSNFIEQGWFGDEGPRVRIVDGKDVELTCKTGRNEDRTELSPLEKVSLPLGRYLLDATKYFMQKRRHHRDGWHVDYFDAPLAGLVIAEIEKPTQAELAVVKLPPWIHSATEVTGYLSNRMLARMAADLRDENLSSPVRDMLAPNVSSIVLTGAPCSGKSTIMADWRAAFSDVLQSVPETATIVIEQVGAKPPVGDRIAMKRFQRTIYRVQLRFEKAANEQALRDGRKALLLDRGTIDSAAYMDNGIVDLERTFRTTIEEEYERYSGVICLDVPPREVYEANKANNPARYESYDEAVDRGRRLREAWQGHPRFYFIQNGGSWDEKVQDARLALQDLLDNP